jgi:hypothetical protein
MSDSIFECLRNQALALVGQAPNAIGSQRDLAPIEQSVDGWFCLLRDGRVAHVNDAGAALEVVDSLAQATALIGRLAVQLPLATWFLPRVDRGEVCPDCCGTGVVSGLPDDLRTKIVCRCGGLGWVPSIK